MGSLRRQRGLALVLLLVFAGTSCGGDEAALPAHPEAARLLREAVDKLRRLDAPSARELLKQAMVFEGPNANALLHVYQADALAMLGFEEEVKEQIALAAAAARRAPRRTRKYVEAVRLDHEMQRARAAALLRDLWDRGEAAADELPTRDDVGLRLAELLAWTFQEEEARAMLATLGQRLPEDLRIPLIEGRIERNSGSRQREQEAFARATELARHQDAPLVLARALVLEAQAWQWQGVLEETESRLRESREIFRAHGRCRTMATWKPPSRSSTRPWRSSSLSTTKSPSNIS